MTDDVTILQGDCRQVLPTLPAESVQMCVTSPPYFGLRDYGTSRWDGGDTACDHVEKSGRNDVSPSALARRAEVYGTGTGNGSAVSPMQYRGVCGKCGATRQDNQLGLEETPDAYVAGMVAVFREVKRVLRNDGTLWLNIGDSYSGSWGNYSGQNRGNGGQRSITVGSLPTPAWDGREQERPAASRPLPGLKPKDLIGIPWMLAFALRADGWYLRSDIIWHKPNVMPESVTDRPTKAHEYLFLLSKHERYYYDADAIREPASYFRPAGPNSRADNDRDPAHGTRKQDAVGSRTYTGFNDRWKDKPIDGRNKRSVWTVATAPYAGAHFATFPEKLIEPCILAGSRPGDIVLDPFFGSGTTGRVALKHGRRCIGIELNPAYIEQAETRTDGVQVMLV